MPLPRLVFWYADAGSFTLEEAASRIPTGNVREEIKYLRSQGWIDNPRRGLYVVNAKKTGKAADPYVLASKMAIDAVLSYHTALELHGVAHTAVFNTLYASTSHRVSPMKYKGKTFRPVVTSARLLDPSLIARTKRAGETIRYSGRELALVQCVDRLQFAGGLDEVLQSVEGFRRIDWNIVAWLAGASTADDIPRDAETKIGLLRKTGFVIERHADKWGIPTDFVELLARKVGRGVTYFGTTPKRGGKWIPRWRVIVPPDVAEGDISG